MKERYSFPHTFRPIKNACPKCNGIGRRLYLGYRQTEPEYEHAPCFSCSGTGQIGEGEFVCAGCEEAFKPGKNQDTFKCAQCYDDDREEQEREDREYRRSWSSGRDNPRRAKSNGSRIDALPVLPAVLSDRVRDHYSRGLYPSLGDSGYSREIKRVCWACLGNHDPKDCGSICTDCHCRTSGALGHGPPCRCSVRKNPKTTVRSAMSFRRNPSQEELVKQYLEGYLAYQDIASEARTALHFLDVWRAEPPSATQRDEVAKSEAQFRALQVKAHRAMDAYAKIGEMLTEETKEKYLRTQEQARVWFDGSRRNPARRNPTEWTIYHADHGISPAQMDFIKKTLTAEAAEGFFLKQIDIPKSLGSVPNALYGPASGDRPVNEAAVHYLDRAGRGWKDRMVDLPSRPCQFVQCIGIREGTKFTVFTIYGGPLAPQNPADPGNDDPEGAQKWWSKHALSAGQWKGGGRTRNKFLLNPKSAVCPTCKGDGHVPNPFAFHGGRPERECPTCRGTGKK